MGSLFYGDNKSEGMGEKPNQMNIIEGIEETNYSNLWSSQHTIIPPHRHPWQRIF